MTTIISNVKLTNNYLTTPDSRGRYSTELDSSNPLVKKLLVSMAKNVCLVYSRDIDKTISWYKSVYRKGCSPSSYIAESKDKPNVVYNETNRCMSEIDPNCVIVGNIYLNIIYKPIGECQIILANILEISIKDIIYND